MTFAYTNRGTVERLEFNQNWIVALADDAIYFEMVGWNAIKQA